MILSSWYVRHVVDRQISSYYGFGRLFKIAFRYQSYKITTAGSTKENVIRTHETFSVMAVDAAVSGAIFRILSRSERNNRIMCRALVRGPSSGGRACATDSCTPLLLAIIVTSAVSM